jgi:hypothetical protein
VITAAAGRSLEPVSPTVTRLPDGDFRAELPDGSAFVLPKAMFK